MTIPWQPGNQGNMIVPAGYTDPHSFSSPLAPPLLVSQYAPAAQAALTAATTSFTAFDTVNLQTGPFVVPQSGRVLVTVSLTATISGAFGFAFGLAAHGTVTPLVSPAWAFADSSATIARPFVLPFVCAGLVPQTAANFDLVGAAASTATLTVLAIGQTAATPNVAANGRGGPVTFIVQPL